MRRRWRRVATAALATGVLLCLAGAATAEPEREFVVDFFGDTIDADPGDGACADLEGQCSLRAAVMEANAQPGQTLISFDERLDSVELDLHEPEDGQDAVSDDLDIRADIVVADDRMAIIGLDEFPIFEVHPEARLELSGLQLTDGWTLGDGGLIRNAGSLVLRRVQLGTSEPGRSGRAIGRGGALFNAGDATLDEVGIAGNSAGGEGGAIYNLGTLTATNTTIAGNTGAVGGGLANYGPAELTHVTLAGNRSTFGEAASIAAEVGVTAVSTIVVADQTNCAGSRFDGERSGFNLVAVNADGTWEDDPSCGEALPGDVRGEDPLLQPLTASGGTEMHPLGDGSPALDAAPAIGCPPADQRGVSRPQGGACDIGAFELEQDPGDPDPPGALVVNTTDDGLDGGCDAVHCSLREAIVAANGQEGKDTIAFNIPGAGPHVIAPLTPLPQITDAVEIDGFTQPGAQPAGRASGAVLMIVLSGANFTAPPAAPVAGLDLATSDSAVRGLVINRAFEYGISIAGALSARNVIAGNVVGVNENCQITQPRSTAGDVPSAITFDNESDTTVDIYWLDYAGEMVHYATLADGQQYLQETWITHPWVALDANGECIGYTLSDTEAKTYVIQPQVGPAGLDVAGIRLTDGATGNTIGGPGLADGNVISGSSGLLGAGVAIGGGASGNEVSGNRIGTSTSGTLAAPNRIGVLVEVSGDTTIRDNLVSGNAGHGIAVLNNRQDGTYVFGNKIGVGVDGEKPMGNGGHGVLLSGSDVAAIGDDGSLAEFGIDGSPNTIAHNGGAGVFLDDTWANRIVANSIHSNAGLGIDLAPEGVTENDVEDGDEGPNGLQNFPDILSVSFERGSEDHVNILAEVDAHAEGSYRIDYYASSVCDPSGNGEGARHLGGDLASSDGGLVSFDSTSFGPVAEGEVITATVTDFEHNTSEFSECFSLARAEASLELHWGSESVEATSRVALENVDASIVFADAGAEDGSATQASPMWNTPIRNTPIRNTPIRNTPIRNTGLLELAVDGAFGDIALSQVPLSRPGGWEAVLQGTDFEHVPLQAVKLRDVFGLPEHELPAPLREGAENPLTLGDLDLSGTPARSVSLASLALGALTLEELPLPDTGPLTPLAAWCAALAGPPINCTGDGASLAGSTVLGLSIQGAPIRNTPIWNTSLAALPLASLPIRNTPIWNTPIRNTFIQNSPIRNTPIRNTPIRNTPIWNTPIRNTPIRNTPIWNTPIRNTPIRNTPIWNTPIRNTDLEASPIWNTPIRNTPIWNTPIRNTPIRNTTVGTGAGSLAIRAILIADLPNPSAVVSCTGCLTLGAASDANAILVTATFEDLGDALGDLTLGQLLDALLAFDPNIEFTLGDIVDALGDPTLGDFWAAFGPDATLGDLLEALAQLDPPVTLGQILILLFALDELAWEDLPYSALRPAAFATEPDPVRLRADVSLVGATSSPTVTMTLPPGFAYVPGTATLLPLVDGPSIDSVGELEDPAVDGRVLTFELAPLPPGNYRLGVSVRGGITLGLATASGSVSTGGDPATATSTTIQVTEALEPNDTVAAATPLDADEYVVSHVARRGDLDFYRYEAAPGEGVTFHLSHVPEGADYDLVVYGPAPVEPTSLGGRSLPQEGKLADEGIDFSARNVLSPEALQDIPIQPNQTLWGLSVNRGEERESVTVRAPAEGATFIVQVNGFNGATSARPYMLRAKEYPPIVLEPCPRTLPHAGTAGTQAPATLPANLQVLFLVNQKRLGQTYGAEAANAAIADLVNRLPQYAARGFPAAVVPVETYAAVQQAYDHWDVNPCSPDRQNGVVRQITTVVDNVRSARPSLSHVVLVGGSDILPHGLVQDATTIANERDYASELPQANQYSAALTFETIATDDPYGDFDPVPYFNRFHYEPDVSLGRLVETPAQISAALARYHEFGGALDPQTSLAMGYEFLNDGTEEMHGFLKLLVGDADAKLVLGDPPLPAWGRQSLHDELLGSRPSLATINAHFDDHRALPAEGNVTGSLSDLFLAETVRDALPHGLKQTAVFSAGCHSGLSLSDVVLGFAADRPDWPQSFAGQQAPFYAGNTGYGYGDSLIVGYTEQLLSLFTEELKLAPTAGEALRRAKQRHRALQAVFGVYDSKVTQQMTFYGLPFLKVGTPTPAPAPQRPPTAQEPIAGLAASEFRVQPEFGAPVQKPGVGEYFEIAGGDLGGGSTSLLANHHRPIEPTVALLAQQAGRGPFITSLQSRDVRGFDPAESRPVFDQAANEPPVPFTGAHPSKIAWRTGKGGFSLVLGQFFEDGDTGVQRLFTDVRGVVYSPSDATDVTPAQFRRVDAVRIGSWLAITVEVEDPGKLPTSVKRVLALVRDAGAATGVVAWKPVELAHVGDGRWTGGVQVGGATSEIMVQAVEEGGFTSTTTNKGVYYGDLELPEAPDGISVTLDGPQSGDWYTDAVSATLAGAGDLEWSVDGGAFQRYTGTAFQITGDGLHTVDLRSSTGAGGRIFVPIDGTPPRIVIVTPASGGSYTLGSTVPAQYVCLDAGSGAATCNGTVPNGAPIDTSAVGSKPFSVSATDAAGNTAGPLTHTYNVVFAFKGFFRPIDNLPTVNVVKAGQGVPVKFSLSGNQGLGIFASGYPKPQSVPCEPGAPTDVVDAAAAGNSALTYDAATDQYTYVWKTDSKWANTCRDLVLRFVDNTEQRARFQFKK